MVYTLLDETSCILVGGVYELIPSYVIALHTVFAGTVSVTNCVLGKGCVSDAGIVCQKLSCCDAIFVKYQYIFYLDNIMNIL
jgi:hypothetical protein